MEKTKKPYLWLLGVNLFISTFTFGGGYVVVPMIRRYFVERRRCFTEEELVSMAAVAQSTPGAIAINPCAFLASFVLNVNVALILAASCLLCVGRVLLKRRARR